MKVSCKSTPSCASDAEPGEEENGFIQKGFFFYENFSKFDGWQFHIFTPSSHFWVYPPYVRTRVMKLKLAAATLIWRNHCHNVESAPVGSCKCTISGQSQCSWSNYVANNLDPAPALWFGRIPNGADFSRFGVGE